LLSSSKPILRTVPIYALVDYDPHGFEIMTTYKHGSLALSHENHRLVVSRILWIGLHSADVPISGWLPLTSRDRKKAHSILRSPLIASKPKWRVEIMRMLYLNAKAEIQSVYDNNFSGLSNLISHKISTGQSIL